eukprot:6204826-Pleurochrysis_carterae.AAC.2
MSLPRHALSAALKGRARSDAFGQKHTNHKLHGLVILARRSGLAPRHLCSASGLAHKQPRSSPGMASILRSRHRRSAESMLRVMGSTARLVRACGAKRAPRACASCMLFERARVSGARLVDARLEQIKEWCRSDAPHLDRLGEPLRDLALAEALEQVDVGENATRLVERAD